MGCWWAWGIGASIIIAEGPPLPPPPPPPQQLVEDGPAAKEEEMEEAKEVAATADWAAAEVAAPCVCIRMRAKRALLSTFSCDTWHGEGMVRAW